MDKKSKLHHVLSPPMNIEDHPFVILKDEYILSCNDLALNLFQYTSKEELIGLKFYQLVFDEFDRKRFKRNITNNITKAFKCTYFRKNNEKFLVNTKVFTKGTSIYIVMNRIDQDDQIQDTSREMKDRYKYLFENHRDVMLLIDPETGSIIECNKSAVSYYGYEEEILLGMKIQDINMLEDHEIYKEMQIAKREERNLFYFSHRLANGEIRDTEVYSVPIKLEDKQLLYSIVYDVTEMRLQKTFFEHLFKNSPLAIVMLNNKYRIIDINENFKKLFQYDLNDVKSKQIREVLYYEDVDNTNFCKMLEKGIFVRRTGKRKKKDNTMIDVDILIYPIINNRQRIGIFVIYTDKTEKMKYERELKLFAKALENNTEGIMITDKEGSISWANVAFTQITGYCFDEVIGKNPRILKSDKHTNKFYKQMWDAILKEGKWKGEIFNKHKNGQIYTQWLNIYSIKDENNQITHFTAIISDITERKKKEEKIEYMAFRDALTGLYNRTFFINQLNHEISKTQNENIAILFLDLDDFKRINDTLGHSVGDKVLKEVSVIIKKCVREIDWVARIGGDEFMILLSQLQNKTMPSDIANYIINALNEPVRVDKKSLRISVSIGISQYPKDGKDAETLIKNADIAMYKAKENKNTDKKHSMLFHPSMDKEVNQEFLLSNHLRYAIEKKELYIYYQPIVEVHTEKIVAAEALLRWKHPEFGLISPEEFIPVAEKTGLINEIGKWVLKNACIQNKRWQNQGYSSLTICVNISVNQLKQKEFPQLVGNILNEINFDPKYLELEITESISTENVENIENILYDLKRLGISLSIDDFGTGYSSLAKLRQLPISKLKIDKSFISDIDDQLTNIQIPSAIIAMAKSLNIKVVAEGIETKKQLECLKDLACEFGQGYLLSPPVDKDSFERILHLQSLKEK
ncbi:EAL domain-containing protein [Marinisporobacter balticus]|uniref:PAS domain S-box-containing protein/diguanylate cyclase (GGDEF)-like protein n=1 Tax=Marinisporobacter balticus TaxID=2018667 RepID=A0A4R2K9F7_9FIRM|nr:EAL domain-containing protein [Marinisporobacter balticus]TCO70041.1 PAS domain S-box-containing protein/diguanylate cyclase (GGDEF)-like protein [Marinisporobacter balticus]